MNLNLQGKRALVCGSTQGLGKACALALADLGASVILFARDADRLEGVMSELNNETGQQHHALVADFTNPAQVKQVLSEYVAATGPIQVVVNNTGGPAPGPAHTADPGEFTAAFDLHLISNHNIVQCLLQGMKDSGYGRIINVISTSVKQPLTGLGVSNTIRGAVASWAKTLSNELGPFGITVNNVLPGATKTARLEAILQGKAKKQNKTVSDIEESDKAAIPLRRFGEAEEFASAVAFLASPAASYITGVNLPVDGGRTGSL
jgi:3-oxoacyl-[acyl-carrier protein] reductase